MRGFFPGGIIPLAIISLSLQLSCGHTKGGSGEDRKTYRCPFSTDRGKLLSSRGIHLFRGVNVSQRLKNPPFTEGVTEEDLYRVRGLGMNAIRLLIFYRAVEPEEGRWNERYLQWVKDLLDLAHNLRIWVILDMHQDLYGGPFLPHGNPTWSCPESEGVKVELLQPWFLNYLHPVVGECFRRFFTDEDRIQKFSKMWQVVALRFADHPALLGFELLNEPFPGSLPPMEFDEEILARWVERVGSAIREVAPCAPILFEPSVLGSSIGLPSRMRVVHLDRLIYAPHFYLVETEQGAPYEPRGSWFFENLLRVKQEEAFRHRSPLFIGEWGNIMEWGDREPGRAKALIEDFLGSAESLLASTFYWEIHGLTHADGTLREFAQAFLRPTLELYQGEIFSYRYDSRRRELHIVGRFARGDSLTFLLPEGMRVAYPPDSFFLLERGERIELTYQGDQGKVIEFTIPFAHNP